MQQGLEIRRFLLVAHAQFAVVVHPRVRPLHHPATRPALGSVAGLRHSLLGHVRDISPLSHLFVGRLAGVTLVHTEILRPTLCRPRPRNYDRVQRLGQQLHVVPIGPGDDKRERGATAVHEQAALGPFFFPDRSGCSPPPPVPEELCLASRPGFAIPRQSRPCRRTPPVPPATVAQRILPVATAENSGEWRWRCRNSWGAPSTGNRCAARTRWRRKPHAAKGVCAHPQVVVGTCVGARRGARAEARAVRHATRAHRRLPTIELSACQDHGGNAKTRQMLFTDKLLSKLRTP